MNNVCKVIWSNVRQQCVAVAENASSAGKTVSSRATRPCLGSAGATAVSMRKMRLKSVCLVIASTFFVSLASAQTTNWATWTAPSSYPLPTTFGGSGSTYAAGIAGSLIDPLSLSPISLTVSGEINNYTALGSQAVWSSYGLTAPQSYLSTYVGNLPDKGRIVQTGYTSPEYQAHTLTFGAPVSNALMSIYSLGNPSQQSTLIFSQPFEILSSNNENGVTRLSSAGDAANGYELTGYEGMGVIQFLGTYSSISWNVTAPEFYGAFNIGMTNTPYTAYDSASISPYSFPNGVLPPAFSSTPDIVSSNNRVGNSGFNLLSNIGANSFNNRFDGGALQVDSNNATTAAGFTITSNNGYIDQNGNSSTFSGAFSNDGSSSGRLYILNTAGGQGARTGRVILNANNTHSGGIEVQVGATLEISNASALGSGRLDLVGTATETATLAVTDTTTITNNITVAGDPTFDIAAGTTTTIDGVISDGTSPGDVVKTGSGTLLLTAANTYTGPTTVSQGTFTVSGSLSNSTAVTVNSGATYNVNATDTIGSLAGAGTVSSSNAGAKVLTAGGDNTSTTFSGVIQNGSGSLGLTKTGTGTTTLSGVNTYTGPTTISAGTLKISGAGAIASSSSVANNATLDVTAATGNVAIKNYTQGSGATLMMNITGDPANNQQVNVTGSARVDGTLNLAATAGSYRPAKYTLLTTTTGLDGSNFGVLATNLASVTNYDYSLGYDANNVYLYLRSTAADTMASIRALGADLNKVYSQQYAIAQHGLSYDCRLFDANNLCLTTGARVTRSRDDDSTNNGVALIAAYRAQPTLRVGAWLDQNESRKMSVNVEVGNSTPMFGAFAVWNENSETRKGLEVKFSAAYGQKDMNLMRPVVGTSEGGQGTSKLSTLVADATVAYGIALDARTSISPFAGLRYANLSNQGYTEGSDVFSPLSFAKARQSAKSMIVGVNLYDKPEGPIGLDFSAGVERYVSTSAAQLSASGLDNLTAVQMTPVLGKNRPFASATLRHDIAKNQQLLVGLSHAKHFTNSDWVTSTTVRYVIGL